MTVQRRSASLRISSRTTSSENGSTRRKPRAGPAWTCRMENPDRAWGPVPEWKSKVRLARKGVNTADGDEDHRPSGIRQGPGGAWGTGWAAFGLIARPDLRYPDHAAGRAPGGLEGATPAWPTRSRPCRGGTVVPARRSG